MAEPRLPIVTKLALLVLAVGLPLSGILAWSMHALFRSEVAAAEQHAVDITNAMATRIEITVDRTRSMLREIAKRPGVQAMDRSNCDSFVMELRRFMPQYANINTFNLRWEFVCSASLNTLDGIVRSTSPELYERMKALDDMVLSGPVRGQLTGKLVVIVAHPVKDAAGVLLGAVTAPIDLSVLSSALTGDALPEGTHLRVISGAGTVLMAHPGSDRIGKRVEGLAIRALAQKRGTSIEPGLDGVERVFAYAPVKGTDWIAISGLPAAEAFADFRRQRNLAVAALALALVLGGWVALVIARRISRPIRQLQRDAEVLASGRLEHRSRVASNDEVGQLAVALNGMAQSLEMDAAVRARAALALSESERRFSDLIGNVHLLSVMLDTDERITYCNDCLLQLTGWRREEVIGRNWFDVFMPSESRDELKNVFAAILADLPESSHYENEILTRSGGRRLVRWNNLVLRSGAGEVIGTASLGEDITELKRSETSIKRLNRVYAVLSGIHTLIARVRNKEELYSGVCRIAVEVGGFRMAWIGVVDPDTRLIRNAGSFGESSDEYLHDIEISADAASPRGHGPTGIAIRENRPVWCQDFRNDPRTALWHERGARFGWGASASLPLLQRGAPVGVLTLYAAEAGVFDDEEQKLLMELAGDISLALDHIEKAEKLDYLAYYDELTGLANRSLFLERVAHHIRDAAARGHKLAVVMINLERFRNINDSLGRDAGDLLLRQVAGWLTNASRDASLLARVGADHFAGVLPQVRQGGDVARLFEKQMDAFQNHPFRLNDATFRVAGRVGIAMYPDDGADAETLLRNAEAALKKAKAGGDRYLFHTQKMTESVAGKLSLENQLREALEREEFVLHYQPKVSLASRKLTGVEALIRWNDPRTGLVPPGRFIPILEEIGLIHEVGRWALRKAIEDFLRWRAAGLPAVRIAVNVSPLQLRNRDFVAEVGRAIGVDAQAPAGLELEITESLIMADVRLSIARLEAIRALGVTVAIDDFGTGFSSLSYLAKLPVDTLKIDRSFVVDMTVDREGLALVSTIINLAHSLKLKVVAEGVETEEQSRLLHLLSCDEMQGFLFSKPVPAEMFEKNFLVPSDVVSAEEPHVRGA